MKAGLVTLDILLLSVYFSVHSWCLVLFALSILALPFPSSFSCPDTLVLIEMRYFLNCRRMLWFSLHTLPSSPISQQRQLHMPGIQRPRCVRYAVVSKATTRTEGKNKAVYYLLNHWLFTTRPPVTRIVFAISKIPLLWIRSFLLYDLTSLRRWCAFALLCFAFLVFSSFFTYWFLLCSLSLSPFYLLPLPRVSFLRRGLVISLQT